MKQESTLQKMLPNGVQQMVLLFGERSLVSQTDAYSFQQLVQKAQQVVCPQAAKEQTLRLIEPNYRGCESTSLRERATHTCLFLE